MKLQNVRFEGRAPLSKEGPWLYNKEPVSTPTCKLLVGAHPIEEPSRKAVSSGGIGLAAINKSGVKVKI
jgi:hypothetical protein